MLMHPGGGAGSRDFWTYSTHDTETGPAGYASPASGREGDGIALPGEGAERAGGDRLAILGRSLRTFRCQGEDGGAAFATVESSTASACRSRYPAVIAGATADVLRSF